MQSGRQLIGIGVILYSNLLSLIFSPFIRLNSSLIVFLTILYGLNRSKFSAGDDKKTLNFLIEENKKMTNLGKNGYIFCNLNVKMHKNRF